MPLTERPHTGEPSPQGDENRRKARRLCRKLLKWGFRIGASALIIVLLLLHLLPFITDTGLVKDLIARQMAGTLQGAHIRLETLRLAPLHKRLLLIEGLSIAPRERPDTPVLTVGTVECRWLPAALLGGGVHITALSVNAVRVDLRQEEGRWNFEDLLPPEEREPFRLAEFELPLDVRVDAATATDVALAIEMEGGITAGVEGISAEAACKLEGPLRGAVALRAGAERVEVQVPQARVILREGLEVTGWARNDGAVARLSGAFSVAALAADLGPLGKLKPLPLAGGFRAEFDLDRLAMPLAEFDLQVPGLLSDALSVSLKSEPRWTLEGENILAADFGELAEALSLSLPDSVRSWGVTGRILAVTEIAGRLEGLEPLHAYVQLTNRLFGYDVGARAEVELPLNAAGAGDESGAPSPLSADASGLRFSLTQEVDLVIRGGLGGASLTDLSCSVGSMRLAVPGLVEMEGSGLRADLSGDIALPTVGRLDVAGSLSLAEGALRSPEFGGVSLPVELSFRMDARDVLDPPISRVAFDVTSGSVGDLVPRFRLTGSATGYGRRELAISGDAVLDVGEAVGLLDGLNEEVRAMVGTLQADGAATVGFEVGGRLPSDGAGGLRIAADGAALLSGMALGRGALEAAADRVESFYSLALAIDPQFLPYNVRAEARAGGGPVSVALGSDDPVAGPLLAVSLERVDAELSGELSGLDLSHVGGELEVSVRGLEPAVPLGPGGALVALGPLSAQAGGRMAANPLAGDLTITDLHAQLPGIAQVTVPSLVVRGFGGDALEGRFRASLDDLGALLGLVVGVLPARITGSLPTVEGRANARIAFDGRLPLAERIVAALEGGRALPRPEFLPLGTFYERDVPLAVDAAFAVEDGAVSYELWPGLELDVPRIIAKGDAQLAQGSLAGEFSLQVPEVHLSGSPVPLEGFSLAADFSMRDFHEFAVRAFRMTGLGGALDVEASLRGSGLSRLQGVPTPGALLEQIDLAARSSGTLRPAALPVVEGLESSGEFQWDFGLILQRGDLLRVAVRPHLADLSLAYGDLFAVEGLDGRFDFSKEWRIVPAAEGDGEPALSQSMIAGRPQAAAAGMRAVVPEFATAADELLTPDDMLTVRSISVLGTELVRDLGIELVARGAAVSVPRFYLHPLGGKLVGAASFRPVEAGRQARIEGEFAGIDFRRMLPAGLRDFRGDARVNGTFMLGALISPEAATGPSYNPIKDVAAELDITEIGPDALDRLLLALDPKAANPSIVRARSALRLASPLRARASLEHGFFSADVELQGLVSGLITEYSIPRFNLANLFGAEMVRDVFRKSAVGLEALNLLDAELLETTPEGAVRLR